MPLTGEETFKAKLQRRSRFAVPKLLRWRCKIESGELLKATVGVFGSENYEKEEFLAKVSVDGRLTIPKLTMEILEQREEKNLAGCILEVTISPAHEPTDASPPENPETKVLEKIKDIRKNLNNAALG